MQWSDQAMLLSARRYGEHGGVIHLLSREHGLYRGLARAAFGKKQRGIFQPGNLVAVNWSARLPEHMGTLSAELIYPVAALALENKLSLAGVVSVAALLEQLLHEHDPHPALYDIAASLLMRMAEGEAWQADYVRFELALLSEMGFGLDLSHCAVTGKRGDLTYVSPKSGRAVCAEAAGPYRDKLFRLPGFLLDKAVDPGEQAIADGLRLNGYFIENWLFSSLGRPVPAARTRLLALLQAQAAPALT